MPAWMGAAWMMRTGGFWSARPPRMVLGHVVYLPFHKVFKTYIWKALGLWNWEADVVRDVPPSPLALAPRFLEFWNFGISECGCPAHARLGRMPRRSLGQCDVRRPRTGSFD